MKLFKCGSIILCLLCYLNNTEAAPTRNLNLTIDFEDDWDYKIQPHSVPLLTISTKNLQLPSSHTYEKELNVDGLGDKQETVNTLTRTPKKNGDVVRTTITCGMCSIGAGLFKREILSGISVEVIKEKFISMCVSLNIESELVCTGFFDVFGQEVVPVFNASSLDAKQICGMILGETCGEMENELHEWDIELPELPPPQPADLLLPEEKTKISVLKVLQLSDTHFDPEYEIGAPANCEEPLCCRSYSSPSEKEPSITAGRWGSYHKCDSPKILIENMLKNIALEHPDIDYIIWTGDLPPHDIWNQTKESNLNIIKETVQQMFNAFPNTPIFPAVGNHEAVPAGSFAPSWVKEEDHSIKWLYTTLADQWRRWLPTTASNTVLHGGFYSVLLKPGFRLISLNTNYCHSYSWWLLVNSTDPANELKWLTYELEQSEKNGEKVHLIGHIPPGSSDCMKVWSRNFYAIIERFQSTVVAQFYGHSHADEFEVFYETAEYSRATSVAYLGPSVTSYINFNPAYRIYYIEGDHEETNREVLDHETWTMDLAKANEGSNEPEWFKLYTARDAYQMKSLAPSEWNRLIEEMTDNRQLFDVFYRNYYRNSPTRPACDSQCKIQILCDLKSGRSHDRRHLCHDLEYSIGL